ncbi:MAG: diguanylate cyclase [Pyrinomonadaceae bacterium]
MSATAHATSTTDHTTQARDQGRVLIVSDTSREASYKMALERAGFVVFGASGGLAAMVAVTRTRPHVVISEAELQGVGAPELARSLERTGEGVSLVLVGNARATTAQRAAALAAGAFDYFEIPNDLELLVARAAQLVRLKQTFDGLRALADRDYLTSLANRRRFRAALGLELERWRRYRVPCALLLVDIDFLKKINDAHGHSTGDTVIRHVADALRELSRDNDTAARLGGEEFALLLAGADNAQALAVAERLRHVVSNTAVENIGTVTVSLGVAACPVHADSERTLYAASDAALYCAKDEGRNRACVAPALNSPTVL